MEIKILSLPYKTTFGINEPLDFRGILLEERNNNIIKINSSPFIKIPNITSSGEYFCKVFSSDRKSYLEFAIKILENVYLNNTIFNVFELKKKKIFFKTKKLILREGSVVLLDYLLLSSYVTFFQFNIYEQNKLLKTNKMIANDWQGISIKIKKTSEYIFEIVIELSRINDDEYQSLIFKNFHIKNQIISVKEID